ncbi:MAG: diguanylate cyclase [Gammaproteobacteria bacterium]|nr:diguanylate cyclase [Gammaproteobacteria bacterium]
MSDARENSKTGKPGDAAVGLNSWKVETPHAERVKLLYSHLPVSLTISVMVALILVLVQARVIALGILIGWFAILVTALVGRAALYVVWRRHALAPSQSETCRWLHWFRVGVIATGIVWGVGGVLMLLPSDPSHKIYVTFVLGGLSAGAATTMGVDRISVNAFMLSVLLPQVILLAIDGDAISLGMSAMVFLFLLFLLATARQSGRRLEENFRFRHEAAENESRLRQMLESSPIATRITDAASNRVVFANSSYITLIDSTPRQVMSIDPSRYYADPNVYADMMARLSKGEHVTNQLIELHFPGEQTRTKWALASYFPVEYQNKPAILGWFYDITDRKLMADQVEHMAYHDTLTGLPNRSLFDDHLKQAIATAERQSSKLALLFLDLDKFKYVNDHHGHHIGDLLLHAVAERISACLRKSDSVARIGGDEFVILLLSVKTEENVLEVAEKIRLALNQPFEIEGLNLHISSSIGVAIYPDHANEQQQLIKRADIAMYYAKAEGRNCVKVYQPEMQELN